ncbi:MAG TPA: hypothetical protein VM689_13720 [Aliidongia sp.]|jgi:uncharacterized coiled-coil DUF342 family protein|nr:hypothetical protein [Aliidongia sp.]
MREPLSKFPKRPTGPEYTRRTIAECRALLANARLSPEMRQGLETRVAQLQEELQAFAAQKAREAEVAAAAAEEEANPRYRSRRV